MCSKADVVEQAVNAKELFRLRGAGVAWSAVLLCLVLSMSAMAIFLPEASNAVVYEDGGLFIDASHTAMGYVMIRRVSEKLQKIRISLGESTLTYDLIGTGAFEVFPLQLGNGKYKVEAFEQIKGDRYSPKASITFKATVEDETFPFLYPNQYVWYEESTLAVAKAKEICGAAATEEDKVTAVYEYVLNHMSYDQRLAMEVRMGKVKSYLPSVDQTLETNTGVCFDFAALVACMLRAEGIPTQMVIGYADKTYHAWNQVYVNGAWQLYDVTTDICHASVRKYTPQRVY